MRDLRLRRRLRRRPLVPGPLRARGSRAGLRRFPPGKEGLLLRSGRVGARSRRPARGGGRRRRRRAGHGGDLVRSVRAVPAPGHGPVRPRRHEGIRRLPHAAGAARCGAVRGPWHDPGRGADLLPLPRDGAQFLRRRPRSVRGAGGSAPAEADVEPNDPAVRGWQSCQHGRAGSR